MSRNDWREGDLPPQGSGVESRYRNTGERQLCVDEFHGPVSPDFCCWMCAQFMGMHSVALASNNTPHHQDRERDPGGGQQRAQVPSIGPTQRILLKTMRHKGPGHTDRRVWIGGPEGRSEGTAQRPHRPKDVSPIDPRGSRSQP